MAASMSNISSLREQILENAFHAFPQVVDANKHNDHRPDDQPYNTHDRKTIIKPNDIFAIVLRPDKPGPDSLLQALLTAGTSVKRNIVMTGAAKETIEEALADLLRETGKLATLMLTNKEDLSEELEDALEAGSAFIDGLLVEYSKEFVEKLWGGT